MDSIVPSPPADSATKDEPFIKRSSNGDRALSAYRLSVDGELWSSKQLDPVAGTPYSNDAQVLFTDLYQITMMCGYWHAGKHTQQAVFDVYFRKCPFEGEFAVLAGVNEVIRFVNTIKFKEDHIEYLREILPTADPEFFDYLRTVDGKELTIYAIPEGSLVFPNEPLVRIEGPLAIAQLVETAVLNLLNYPTLVATNAARHRLTAGWDKVLLEFGARRAQGPDGAMSASRYSYLGGFDGTSNVRAGHIFGIPVYGTLAHAFITSFKGLEELTVHSLKLPNGAVYPDFVELVLEKKKQLVTDVWPQYANLPNEGELASFIAFAQAFPNNCLCLVDTYDTLSSGTVNFLAVAWALRTLGIKSIGIRLDSGDLAYLSSAVRCMFREFSEFVGIDFRDLKIVASNDINEKVLQALNNQNHCIDSFGIGTNLVTCQKQPALGMVYKLSELEGRPCMKLSQDAEKSSIPSRKMIYRLFSKVGEPVLDLILRSEEKAPEAGQRIFCGHLWNSKKRCYVVPHRVQELLKCYWENGVCKITETIDDCRQRCLQQLQSFRPDILRTLNPTPYKVSTSLEFFNFMRDLWEQTSPIYTLE